MKWLKLIVVGVLTGSVIGCNAEMPVVQRGMTLEQRNKELAGRWPPVRPVAVRLKRDGTMREVFVQESAYTNTYIVVDHRNGVITDVEYTITGN